MKNYILYLLFGFLFIGTASTTLSFINYSSKDIMVQVDDIVVNMNGDVVAIETNNRYGRPGRSFSNGNSRVDYNISDQVRSVGSTGFDYNLSGKLRSVGNTRIDYNLSGQVRYVGNNNIEYDLSGNVRSVGSVDINSVSSGSAVSVGNIVIAPDWGIIIKIK